MMQHEQKCLGHAIAKLAISKLYYYTILLKVKFHLHHPHFCLAHQRRATAGVAVAVAAAVHADKHPSHSALVPWLAATASVALGAVTHQFSTAASHC